MWTPRSQPRFGRDGFHRGGRTDRLRGVLRRERSAAQCDQNIVGCVPRHSDWLDCEWLECRGVSGFHVLHGYISHRGDSSELVLSA